MNDLSHLEEIARAAAVETDVDEDWFCPDLIESREPISSGPAARRYIAAFSPETVLALLAVCKAAKVYCAREIELGWGSPDAKLAKALKALDKK